MRPRDAKESLSQSEEERKEILAELDKRRCELENKRAEIEAKMSLTGQLDGDEEKELLFLKKEIENLRQQMKELGADWV
ncbi:MAG: hypothetical protein ACK413_01615 [Patescibacteria group bacterium]